MSNRITVDHLGHLIVYDDDKNVWECEAMKVSAKSLKACKSKLDEFDKARRRLPNIPAIVFPNNYTSEVRRVRVTMIAQDGKSAWIESEQKVWGRYGGTARIETVREKCDVKALFADTPEFRAEAAAYQALDKEATEARRKVEAARKALETGQHVMTPDKLRALVPAEPSDG